MTPHRPRKTRLRGAEILENRSMMAGQPLGSLGVGPQSLDGTGNNLANPEWGSSLERFLRTAAAEYADAVAAPAGGDRPSGRVVSNALSASPAGGITNDRDLSAFIYSWGQFLDHDLTLTGSADPVESFPISIPSGDPSFDPTGTGAATMPFARSAFDPSTGHQGVPREQINSLSAFIDGSQVYGTTADVAASLRSFAGGRLRTSDGDMLPLAEDGQGYLAGDIRVNENPGLIALHTLFVREHNRFADEAASRNPSWSDEDLFQHARRLVIAELQAITYQEFLPSLLGRTTPAGRAMASYRGYRADVNPGITNEFATAAYRLGHSLLGDEVGFLDDAGNAVREPLALRDAFFNTAVVAETGVDPILKYLASDQAQELDTMLVDDVRTFLFGPPGAGGFDLAALNIQRGRDHGLADYNDVREAYGLPRLTSFAQITTDTDLQADLAATYGSIDDVDLWVAGLAESHLPGSSVGETFTRIIVDQFSRLRDGDRYWYQSALPKPLAQQVARTTLADVIRRNTDITNLQSDVFVFRTVVAGTVFADTNADGRFQSRERPIAAATVTLVNPSGAVVASTATDARGHYSFEDLDLGSYRIVVATPGGSTVTGREIAISRGMEIRDAHVAIPSRPATPPGRQPRAGQPGGNGPAVRSLAFAAIATESNGPTVRGDSPDGIVVSRRPRR